MQNAEFDDIFPEKRKYVLLQKIYSLSLDEVCRCISFANAINTLPKLYN